MNPRYVVSRIINALVILFVVITLNFILPRLVFSDPAEPLLHGIPDTDLALRELVRKEYGLDGPLFEQYIRYLGKMARFDYGISYMYNQPVFEVMFSKIPWSLVLTLSAMIISSTAGIFFGARAAQNRGKRTDKTLLNAAMITTAIPGFWLAMVLIIVFCFIIPLFPVRGAMTEGYVLVFNKPLFFFLLALTVTAATLLHRLIKKPVLLFILLPAGLLLSVIAATPPVDLLDILHHAFLPVLVICTGSILSYAMMVRNSMIAVVGEDYITTARAKGLTERSILFGHTLRNALLPMVTSIGMSMAGLFGGSVLIERIFSWPGMGDLLIRAQSLGDFQLAQGIMFFYSLVTIVSNLLTDFIYHKLDPRVKINA